MKTIGIIDIGSNSVRLILVNIGESNSVQVIDELKESIRLGEGMEKDLCIPEEKINSTIKTLESFKNLCDSFNTSDIIAVATEAVRKAKNQKYFLDRVEKEVNLKIRVLTGEEEGYYDYFGVINSISIKNALIMDIGGASTELALVKNRKLVKCISLPFGSITLTNKFKIKDELTSEQEQELKEFLTSSFEKISWLNEINTSTLIGIGGSIRNLSKVDRKYKNYPINTIHNYSVDSAAFKNIYSLLKTKTLEQRSKVKGLSAERADIIVGASCAVSTIIDMCNIKKIVISGRGLREGLLYDYICDNGKPFNDILDVSIKNMLLTHNSSYKHAMHVYNLTKTLFDDLKELHGLSNDVENVLKTAAMLHDIGISITYYDHHKHSFYMILNGQLDGLTHKEIIMSAYTAAFHRKEAFKSHIIQYKSIINKDDMDTIEKLGIFVRIAESLDRSMTGVIEKIKCQITDDAVIIKTISNSNTNLEISDALKAASTFKNIYGKKLYIV
ncbi:MAG: exopolyphosphatase [Bacillota bacterium]|nr:exopolyphosphatase [Bacillota bacterium]